MQSEQKRMKAFERANEEQRKIYCALDNLLEEDIIICKDNEVLIKVRLGDKVICEYPVCCEVIDNEVKFYEYAESKSMQSREE